MSNKAQIEQTETSLVLVIKYCCGYKFKKFKTLIKYVSYQDSLTPIEQ